MSEVQMRCFELKRHIGVALLLLLMLTGLSAQAQSERPRISPENAQMLVQITSFKDEWFGGVAWSPDGKTLAVGVRGGVRLFDIETMTFVDFWEGYSSYVEAVAFTPDGSLLISGGMDFQIGIWDVVGHKQVNLFRVYSYFDLDQDWLNMILRIPLVQMVLW